MPEIGTAPYISLSVGLFLLLLLFYFLFFVCLFLFVLTILVGRKDSWDVFVCYRPTERWVKLKAVTKIRRSSARDTAECLSCAEFTYPIYTTPRKTHRPVQTSPPPLPTYPPPLSPDFSSPQCSVVLGRDGIRKDISILPAYVLSLRLKKKEKRKRGKKQLG